MHLKEICEGVRKRLPGGSYAKALAAVLRLRREHHADPFYGNLLRLNLRAFFCIRPHYGPLVCAPAVPPGALYHITETENLSSVKEKGLLNPVTGVVFLAESPKSAVALTKRKRFFRPVLLETDSAAMLADGYRFFINREKPYIWLTERVPPEYLRTTDSAET